MNRALRFLCLGLVLTFASPAFAADGGSSLPRSSPEQQGVSSTALLGFIDAADSQLDSLHSFMLVRHGNVVTEGWWAPYNPESRHELYSLSKSFTSTAVGLAISEGKLTLDDSVLAAFPEDAPSDPSTNLKSMRLRDLLRMSAGQQTESKLGAEIMCPKTFLAHPVPFKPGTHFLYNTPATFMASAMVQKATGQSVLEYLKPRLFEPLGISNPTWDANFQGVSLGGYGLYLKTEDIAKFGQLLLQKGQWHGQQIVPAAWIEQATSLQTSNGSNPKSDWEQGYGYQFWRCRNGAFRGDGAFGQYVIVIPEHDAVIAITSGIGDMPAVLNLIWEKVLPALQSQAISDNPEARQKLEARLKGLSIKKPKGMASSPTLEKINGKTYAFSSNDKKLESLKVEAGSTPGDLTITTKTDGKEQVIACSAEGWKRGTIQLPQGTRVVAANGAWTSEDTYTARVALYETPFILTLSFKFAGDEVFYDSQMNIGRKDPQLVGRKN